MQDGIETAISRRRLLARAVAGIASAGLPAWFTHEAIAAERAQDAAMPRRIAANATLNVGAIGVGGRKGGYQQGLNDTRSIGRKPGVKIVAVCDVDSVHRDEGAAFFGADCARFTDFRDLLARKDIDAVVIGTPDHWHVPIALAALKAGKHVYCEKPLTLFIEQGKKLVRAQQESKLIFQVGSQQRSDSRFRLACTLVRNGRLGKISRVTAHLPTGPIGGPFDTKPVPADLDWDLWLGPSPVVDYLPERVHGTFRWWLAYSGGMLTDWGAHHNDIAQWGLGTDRSGPVTVQATGKIQPITCPNCYDTYPEFDVYATYANGTVLHTTNQGENGVEFQGERGRIFVSRSRIAGYNPDGAENRRLLDEPLPAGATRLYESNDHHLNFVQSIRQNRPAICDAEIGHRSATLCHLGNIALRLGGRKLEWDPKAENFKNDEEANGLVDRTMRSPWAV